MLPSPAWKTLAMRMSCLRPISVMQPEDVRQLGPGHDAVLRAEGRAQPADGAEGPLAGLPDRRRTPAPCGSARRSRSGPPAAVGPDDRGDRLGLARPGPASRPSTSMIRTAPASVGKPKPKACSTARIIRLSSISSAAGTIPAAIIPLTVSVAGLDRVEDAEEGPARLRVAGQVDDHLGDDAEGPLVADDQPGQVITRGVSSVAPPVWTTVPSGSTSSTPRTWLTVTPYLSVCGPPELVATLPPMVQAVWLEGSGA